MTQNLELHIIWDKEQIRYSSYLPKYATHTFLIPNIHRLRPNFEIGSLVGRNKCQ